MGDTDCGGNWVLFWWVGLSKSWIQFAVDGLDCDPSLFFDLRPNYGRGNEDNGDLLQKVQCHTPCPWPCSRPPRIHVSTRDSWTLMGKCRSVSWEVTAPFSWALLCTTFVFALLCKFWWLSGGVNGDLLQKGLTHTQVCCTQSANPCGRPLLTCTSAGDTQTLKGRSGSVSVGSPGAHKFYLSSPSISGGYGVWF